MSKSANRNIVLGFLTVVATESGGYRGGYLLTSDYGRPIEFHYTAELRLTSQQRILYGTSLEPIVYAEVLAKPLTDKQKTAPRLITVNHAALLELRRLIPAPVVKISSAIELDSEGGRQQLVKPVSHADFADDVAAFEKIRALCPQNFDWLEPFERLEEALGEVIDPNLSLVA